MVPCGEPGSSPPEQKSAFNKVATPELAVANNNKIVTTVKAGTTTQYYDKYMRVGNADELMCLMDDSFAFGLCVLLCAVVLIIRGEGA